VACTPSDLALVETAKVGHIRAKPTVYSERREMLSIDNPLQVRRCVRRLLGLTLGFRDAVAASSGLSIEGFAGGVRPTTMA
jgi:hypothetical protein